MTLALTGAADCLYIYILTSGVGVAQLAEHWIVAPVVVGSNPIAHPPQIKHLQRFNFPVFPLMWLDCGYC